jgi:tryptophan synthase beta chain
MSITRKKVTLSDDRLPRSWYNLAADLPRPPAPPLHPGTMQPVGPEDLAPLFPMALIEQEVSAAPEIPIPEPVLQRLALYRPSPLIRATALEEALGTPARIYYKYEGVSPAGSHKPNTALAQAYYCAQEGVRRITTETGAGQWGTALAYACQQFGIDCEVYMVRVSFEQKPYRRLVMQTYGASCVPSPSERTAVGRRILAEHPDTPGSLGIAISEAIERALEDEATKYSLGSVLNHVLLHQTIIGLETREQLEIFGERSPDVVVGCVGGGSNFAGLSFPFVRDRIHGASTRIVAVEPRSCPTMTRGPLGYDFGDLGQLTPLMPMHTLGHGFVPPPIHAGGLRYHGVAPLISQLILDGLVDPVAIGQLETFEAGLRFARSEGIIPAPESNHAVAAAIREAEQAREAGEERVIVFGLSGHGLLDLAAYEAYMAGSLEDHALEEDVVQRALETTAAFPAVPGAQRRAASK